MTSPVDFRVKSPVYLALMHTDVTNRHGAKVTTSVTNMDIHDISRSVRTYGLAGYFIVTPIVDQHQLVGKILAHWRTERSQAYHPDRVEALSTVELFYSFAEVKAELLARHQHLPEVALTDARKIAGGVSYADYRQQLEQPTVPGRPVVLVFGTGWGIAPEFHAEVDRVLVPIEGPSASKGYNHLSVRSAVAVILDRLFGG